MNSSRQILTILIWARGNVSPAPLLRLIFHFPVHSILLSEKSANVSSTCTSTSFVDKAVNHLKNSKYYTAFRTLLKNSRPAKEALKRIVADCIRKEVSSLTVNDLPLSKKLSVDSLEKFEWGRCLSAVESQLPILSTAIKTAMVPKKNSHKLTYHGKPGKLTPSYGFLMSTILKLRMPSKITFLQDILSVEMYRSGCNQKHDLGNFTPDDTVVVPIENITEESTVPAISEISETESNSEEGESLNSSNYEDELDGIVPLLESSTILESENGQTVAVVNDIYQQLDPGFSICWDNVQKLSTSRHSAKTKNEMMLWALAFASRNRISFRHLDFDASTCPAISIPLEKFFPSDDDWEELKNRMCVLTQRILKKNFQAFQMAEVQDHINHQFSSESSVKSQIVNLGVLKENPSTCKGVIAIMKELHKYVPADANGDPFKIICHGDQLSVERMIDAKLAMAGSENPFNKLAGLIPRPQGFHKRNIILQDAMNKFYLPGTAAVKGSLFQIRNKFEFRNVKKKTSDCINSCVDLWNFVTEGYVCLLACKICKINSLDETPIDIDTSITTYVEDLSHKIIEEIWPNIYICKDPNDTFPYTDFETTLVYEDEFDREEFDADDEDLAESDDNESSDEENLRTNNQENEIYDKFEDHMYQHSCALLFTGLKMMADKDSERENDGPAMLSHWRINMIDFMNNNHNKYMILCHRLLSAVNGWLPKRLREELVWNSTLNLTGTQGGNLALDLANEFQNNDFKTNLKNSHGQYSDNQISRCSKITGSLGKSIEAVFATAIMDKHISAAKTSDVVLQKGVSNFLKAYLSENLFHKVKGRHCHGLHQIENTVRLEKPNEFQKRLVKYSLQLEKERYVCQ